MLTTTASFTPAAGPLAAWFDAILKMMGNGDLGELELEDSPPASQDTALEEAFGFSRLGFALDGWMRGKRNRPRNRPPLAQVIQYTGRSQWRAGSYKSANTYVIEIAL